MPSLENWGGGLNMYMYYVYVCCIILQSLEVASHERAIDLLKGATGQYSSYDPFFNVYTYIAYNVLCDCSCSMYGSVHV